MATDGFTQVDPERTESLAAVRSVLADVLDRDGGWAELAEAGLLGLAVPEEYGGEGLGLPEVSVLLRETGTRAKHLPVWETLCCGALVVAGAGTDEQKQALLPGIASGELLLTPAFREAGKPLSGPPGTTYADGTVTGRKIGVTFADRAEPPAGPCAGRRHPGRRARRRQRPRRLPARVRLQRPDRDPHRRPRRRSGRAPR